MSSNLKARIERHLKMEKKRHWHIDYLLGTKATSVKALVYAETLLEAECKIAQIIEGFDGAEILARGFGSSDCRCGCGSHLHYMRNRNFENVVSRVCNVYMEILGCCQLVQI